MLSPPPATTLYHTGQEVATIKTQQEGRKMEFDVDWWDVALLMLIGIAMGFALVWLCKVV